MLRKKRPTVEHLRPLSKVKSLYTDIPEKNFNHSTTKLVASPGLVDGDSHLFVYVNL